MKYLVPVLQVFLVLRYPARLRRRALWGPHEDPLRLKSVRSLPGGGLYLLTENLLAN